MRRRRMSALVVTVVLLLAACGDDGPAASIQVVMVEEPTVTVGPNPAAPLTAVVHAVTQEPATFELTITDGTATRVVVPDPTPTTDHAAPVLGLSADTEYDVVVSALDDSGEATVVAELAFETPSLPDELRDLTVVRPAVEGAAEPGVTMFGARRATDESSEAFLVIVDGNGEVVWYYDDGVGISDSRRLSNGNLVFLHSGNQGMREIDMLGNVVAEWTATGWDAEPLPGSTAVDTDSFHHEVIELPDGDEADFMVLSTELRPFDAYPADYPGGSDDGDQGPDGDDEAGAADSDGTAHDEVGVLGDTIVAFDRDGTIVDEWSLLDILDPYRISYDALGTDWKVVYEDEDTRDWSHANAVVLDPADGNMVVSLRNQDAVIKIDRDSGELMWILGDPGAWNAPWSDNLLDPVDGDADFEWSYHQHAPMFTPAGTMMLFDNGNGRAIPPDPELDTDDRYSRAVEYVVDDDAGTVEQLWAYGAAGDDWYSGALGDADYLPETGNVLVTDGFRTADDDRRWARVFEVTRAEPGEIVFEVSVASDDAGWTIYRAEHLVDVYPPHTDD